MNSIDDLFQLVLQHRKAGRWPLVEKVCRQILGVAPDHAAAWHELGMSQIRQGHAADAMNSLQRAVALQPNHAPFHCSLGDVLLSQGQPLPSIDHYRNALTLQPDFPEALNNLGYALRAVGKFDEACGCYRRAISLRPHFIEAHYNFGNLLQQQGELSAAVASYEHALRLRPEMVTAWINLGNALQAQGSLAAACNAFERAINLRPDSVDAYNNLGNARRLQGRLRDAVVSYQHALRLRPDQPDALNHLGNALRDLKQFEDAQKCYERAVQLKPDFPSAVAHQIELRQRICAWDELTPLSESLVASVESDVPRNDGDAVPPFIFIALPIPTTPAQQLKCARKWGAQFRSTPHSRTVRPTHRERLTIGYLSGDFRAHPMGYLTAGLIEHHDRSRFRIIGYSYGQDDGSAIRQRLSRAFDRFVDLHETSHRTAADRIADDGVDILVDLTGFTQYGRPQIPAFRPAPIQVSYLGYPGSMGVPFIDYVVVDQFLIPADQQPFYSEKLVHLPGCYQVNDRSRMASPSVLTRADCGLPERGFVFCCFNNSYKITPAVFDVWMRLLDSVPGSVLWLTSGNSLVVENLRKEASRRGVVADRLVFSPTLPMADYLARYALADLFLDTWPYTAGATASDALWMGCPVLTRAGTTCVSRMAGSILHALGLPELITQTVGEYFQLAQELATDPERLRSVRSRLATSRETSSVYDARQFASHLEAAYQQMWEESADDRISPV